MKIDLRLPRVLHVLIHLSLRDRVMSSTEIADMLAINPVVVRRMLAALRDHGLIESTMGRLGGWRVAKPLDAIPVNAVYEALGRPNQFSLPESGDHPGCPVEAAVNRVLREVEREAADFVRQRYSGMSLGDIAREALA